MITKVYYALDQTGATFEDAFAQGLRIAEFNFPKPAVKTVTVDVPGRDGLVDLTDALTGYPTYENIQGAITFIVLKGAIFDLAAFINKFHGRRIKLYTDEDTTHYYVGRATVTAKTLKLGRLQTFTLSVDADPFLWDMTETSQSLSVLTGNTTGWTLNSSTNMASGYPTMTTKKITLKNSTPTESTATYRVPVDDTKVYVCVADGDTYTDHYEVISGLETIQGTGLIRPAPGQTYVDVKFYLKTGAIMTGSWNNVVLVPMDVVLRNTASVRTTLPYIQATRSCSLFVAQSKYSSNVTEYRLIMDQPFSIWEIDPIKNSPGDETGIYIGLGGAGASGTAKLKYRGGVLA